EINDHRVRSIEPQRRLLDYVASLDLGDLDFVFVSADAFFRALGDRAATTHLDLLSGTRLLRSAPPGRPSGAQWRGCMCRTGCHAPCLWRGSDRLLAALGQSGK